MWRFARSIEVLRDLPVAWTVAADDRFALSLGNGQLLVRPDRLTPGTWFITEHVQRGAQLQVVADGLLLDYAISLAEEHAASRGATALLNPNGAWRNAPASEKQLRFLRSLRVRISGPLTQGEASALIDAAKARRVA